MTAVLPGPEAGFGREANRETRFSWPEERALGNQGFPTSGKPADVVREADHEEHEDEPDSHDRDPLVDLPPDGPSADAFGDREDDVAAVQGKERQQVEQRDRERDQAQDEEEALGPLFRRVGGALDDPDGLEMSFRPSPVTSRPSEAPISRVTRQVRLSDSPAAGRTAGPRPRG